MKIRRQVSYFFLRSREGGAMGIARMPHLDEATTAIFGSMLANANAYLEYGSGGSTHMALSSGVEEIRSVESDSAYLDAVRRSVCPEDTRRFKPIHVDIGPTLIWGRPVPLLRRSRWPDYVKAPWADGCPWQPDLVLVDGRFRVAAVAECAIRCGPDWTGRILVDDFLGRDQYRAMLDLATGAEPHGRAMLLSLEGHDPAFARRLSTEFRYDWR